MSHSAHHHHYAGMEPAEEAHHAIDKHAGHSVAMFRNRFLVCSLLTVPVLIWSDALQHWMGYRAPRFAGSDALVPLFSTVIFLYGGLPFLEGALRELRARLPGMMTLIALAITVAFLYSIAITVGVVRGMPFYWELSTLIDVMLLGHWLEMVAVGRASQALQHLAALLPAQAHRLQNGEVVDIPVADLKVGDRVLVRPGEQIPVDGVVLQGSSTANEAFLTGESRPVEKQPGDEVIAGAINGEGMLVVEARRVGQTTTLFQMLRLVEDAQRSRSRFQVLGDRLAFWLTLIAVGIALITTLAWHFAGSDWQFTLERAVTVLVIACPHALGLAIPLVMAQLTGLAAHNGILIRTREAVERALNLQLVAFDKTGTLTEGRFGITGIYTNGVSSSDALRLAATLESGSAHPLARAIVETADTQGITPDTPQALQTVPGKGIEGVLNGQTYRLGRPEWLTELGIRALPPALQQGIQHAEQNGESAIVLSSDSEPLALFTLADQVRAGAREVIQQLHQMGLEVVMITGDAEAVARAVATQLGIDQFYARILPQEKAQIVRTLREEGKRIAFVGDGINDAPALLSADIGFAIGAGTNVAIESADVVLIENDPRDVVLFLALARLSYRKMVQNLLWATGYNVVALPLAAGVAVRWGILLSPALGALLMSLSTVLVAINALLMRRNAPLKQTQGGNP